MSEVRHACDVLGSYNTVPGINGRPLWSTRKRQAVVVSRLRGNNHAPAP